MSFFLPIGLVLLGVAMFRTAAFGPGFGWLSVVLGVVGVAAAVVVVIDPLSLVAVIGFFALIAFHLATGWRPYRLSRASSLTA